MSQTAVHSLHLVQVALMPLHEIPIACCLLQTGDGQDILIDSGLAEFIPACASDFEK